MTAAPGEDMDYSTGNSHLLSAILTKATGMSTVAVRQTRRWPGRSASRWRSGRAIRKACSSVATTC